MDQDVVFNHVRMYLEIAEKHPECYYNVNNRPKNAGLYLTWYFLLIPFKKVVRL